MQKSKRLNCLLVAELAFLVLWTMVIWGHSMMPPAVSAAESDWVAELLRKILAPYQGQLDAIVLGCTHYPFVKAAVRKVLGDQVVIVDGGAGTARHTKRCLEERGWLREEGTGSLQMENSSGEPRLLDLGMELLNK